MIGRRALGGAGLALALARPGHGRAPRTVTLLVGARPGRGSDVSARAFAPYLERHLPGSRVAVANHPGGAGLAALRALAAADADGSLIGWVSTPALPARTIEQPDAAGLLAQLVLVGSAQKEPVVFVTAPEAPPGSVADLLRRAGDSEAPMALGTPPPGSPGHLAALRLRTLASQALGPLAADRPQILPFPSAAAARQAAQAGNVAAAALGLVSAIEALRAGSLAGLGIAARRRSDAYPDIAPLREAGLDLSSAILRGLAVPPGTAPDTVAALERALAAVVADPEYRTAADETGFRAEYRSGPAWTRATAAERALLETIWQTTPWKPADAG